MSALWTPKNLLAATGGMLRGPFSANGISIDSRSVRPGQMFIALVGENGDGHTHVAAALARGASGAMVHKLPDDVADDAKLLMVADTFTALHDLGRFARARLEGRLVAVTGSVGKTTTKDMLRTILSAQGKTWAAEASHNNHWGVPLTLARMPPQAKFVVAEIGMNHAGEIAPLARLARPHVAVVSTVAPAHIGHLGSIEAIADEKASIAQGLEPGGVLLLPADSPLLERMRLAAGDVRIETFGTDPSATHRLLHALPDADGTDLHLRIAGQEIRFRLAAPGLHMAMNAVAALAAAAALGADPLDGAASLADFTPGAGRGARRNVVLSFGTITLLDESYNASPIAVRAALALLGLVPASRRIAVLGDMLELGEAAPAEHQGLAPDVLAHADLLFTCGPLMQGLHDAIPPSRRGAHAADSASLAPLLLDALRLGDAVLVKGSLGSRMKMIVAAIEAAAPIAVDQPEDPR
jgi:UDP-N-acetylmuramoyl-tripeptide--D-alanyl-D-alanine ligase